MAEARKVVINFHYAEKIKSDLIVASNLLEFLEELKNAELIGAEKLLDVYFNTLVAEVNIVANASQAEAFRSVASKLKETAEQVAQRNYVNARRLLSEAISLTTTQGSLAAKILKEKDLI